jgi:hypothetical protein
MSTLWIGARHLSIPVVSVLPVLHGFLVLEVEDGMRTFSADRGKGVAPALLVYERRYAGADADAQNVVALRMAVNNIDANRVLLSFRSTLQTIEQLNLRHNLLNCNCNTVVTTLILQAGRLELPPPPAVFLPGYGRAIL